MSRLSTVIFSVALNLQVSESQLISHRAGAFLLQLFVNSEDIQVRKLTSCHRLRPVASRRIEELYIHPKACYNIALAKRVLIG